MRQNANKMPIADQGRKNVQELDSVGVVDKYRHAYNSAGHYMIQRAPSNSIPVGRAIYLSYLTAPPTTTKMKSEDLAPCNSLEASRPEKYILPIKELDGHRKRDRGVHS